MPISPLFCQELLNFIAFTCKRDITMLHANNQYFLWRARFPSSVEWQEIPAGVLSQAKCERGEIIIFT